MRTRNPVLALIAREYLHHDLVLQRAQIAIGFGEWDRWWQADPELRGIIISGGERVGAHAGAEETVEAPPSHSARQSRQVTDCCKALKAGLARRPDPTAARV